MANWVHSLILDTYHPINREGCIKLCLVVWQHTPHIHIASNFEEDLEKMRQYAMRVKPPILTYSRF